GQHVAGLLDAVVGDLGDVDQAVHAGHHLGKGAEGHQLDHAHVGGVAHLIGGGEHGPGVLAAVLHAQGDLLLLGVEGNDVHVHGVAHLHHLRGVLDAAPGQLGDVDHAVHAADIHESAVGSQGLHGAGVVLALLDLGPDLLSGGGALSADDAADGAHHA